MVVVDNGNIHLKVLRKHRNHLDCEVLTEGTLGSRRHINLPGVRVNLPALTDKDLKDIELGIELGSIQTTSTIEAALRESISASAGLRSGGA